jgi:hypothetical protein
VLLLPTGHYILGGAAAVAASFLALTVVPPKALDRFAARRLVLGHLPVIGRAFVSFLSFAVFVVLLAAGFLGSRDPLSNPLPLVTWTLLWVGLTLVQGLLGNLWSWINPWYGPCRLATRLLGSNDAERTGRLPERAGYWPAMIFFFAFAWFELVYPAPDDPARLAWAAGVYWLANFLLMLVFGYEAWSSRGECLSVFFGMVSRLSLFELAAKREGAGHALSLGWPGAKLREIDPLPMSGVFFLLLVLGSVSFDGLSKTFFWLGANGINPLEFPGRSALTGINTAGLILTFTILASVFLLAVFLGERLALDRRPFGQVAGLLVWSIAPIALAYHFSHYLTALVVNGQYALVALSDPFACGWNIFGTAHLYVAPGMVMGAGSAWVIWNLQAGAIVGGHILAVLIAHMLASRLHPSPRQAVLSQIPLALLMIAYTIFGLWLLSTPTAG